MRLHELFDDNLDEDWKHKLAAGAVGVASIFGTNYANKEPATVRNAVTNQIKDLRAGVDHLKQGAMNAGIKGQELVHFLSQAAHETLNFTRMAERGTSEYFTKKYDKSKNPRMAQILGNTEVGDGVKYRGRGYLHLTGRWNYEAAGKAIGQPLGQNPDLMNDPAINLAASIWYWKNRVRAKVGNFTDVKAVTKAINPGMKGAKDRAAKFAQFNNPSTTKK